MPRGSITGGGGGGGREVTDKRESYKMGCAMREIRGEGTTPVLGTKVSVDARRCPWGTPMVREPGGQTPTLFCSSRGCNWATKKKREGSEGGRRGTERV